MTKTDDFCCDLRVVSQTQYFDPTLANQFYPEIGLCLYVCCICSNARPTTFDHEGKHYQP